ncbi:HTH-type transcriptional regulator MtrR [Anaerotignum neopropionicum]|uniref:HTH-type transcriptional regulator MtrR n=1 Tax=Anaerotignum neopropionicum TaxID=36847 RepID=A0A136WIG4_9FIRM|nr:TetR/AcrR family transcriptional regulator [Anaerotignum neopropionicum]KXL54231.1 HTH-type transcriptional regulator MtrR [Anaerotignum neopropionicum]KXL54356.1 HTH-type transcriptional regulator MtrR [Anaerotignum neopropionicum]
MKNDKETKERLLLSGKKEFLEKGYARASLRNICKNARVTTGALYFFFENKEELFVSIVEQPLQELQEIMNQHQQHELEQLKSTDTQRVDDPAHFQIAKKIICCMYRYYDEFQLLLTKAQGSRFEQIVDEFVEIMEKKYQVLANGISMQNNSPKVESYMIHWFTHTQVDLFVHIITHEKSEETAIKHLETMIQCLVACWYQLFE